MRKMNAKEAKHLYDKDKSGPKLSVEAKLLKEAAALKYAPGAEKKDAYADGMESRNSGQSPLAPYYGSQGPASPKLQRRVAETTSIPLGERFAILEYGDGGRDSPVLSVRRIHYLEGGIEEASQEHSEGAQSTTNLSYFRNSDEDEQPEAAGDDSELEELKRRVGLVNPVAAKKKKKAFGGRGSPGNSPAAAGGSPSGQSPALLSAASPRGLREARSPRLRKESSTATAPSPFSPRKISKGASVAM